MAKVTVIVAKAIEVEVTQEQFEALHLPVVENPAEEDLPQDRYDAWHAAIEEVGNKLGYDLDPEEGGEWFRLDIANLHSIEAMEGVMAIVDTSKGLEHREILAQA